MLRALLVTLLVLPLGAEWLNDLKAGQKKAAEEEKDLYLVFTSLKISGACVQLEKKVLSQDSFQKAAGDRFVLVHLDVPLEERPGMEDPLVGNKFTARIYDVESFPTALYLDQKGRKYLAEAGALPLGPEEYAAHLIAMSVKHDGREQAMKAAYEKEGMERAKAIIEVIKSAPRSGASSLYGEQLEELGKLDPEDRLGFQKAFKAEVAFREMESAVKATFHKDSYGEVVKLVDDFLKEHQPEGEMLQKALFRKLAALRHGKQTEEAIKTAEAIIAANPDSSHGRLAAQILKSLK